MAPQGGCIKRWWPSSVCPVSDTKSRMEGRSKLKIVRKEAHDTGDLWPHLEVERSKVKVFRLINAETENVPYLPKGETDIFQTWYRDEVRWPASLTCAVTSKVKVKVIRLCRQSDACLPITQQRKVAETTEIGRKVVWATVDILHQFQGKKVKGQAHQAA